MTENVLSLISNLFSVLIHYSFMKCVLNRKAEKKLDYILIAVLYAASSLNSIFMSSNGVVKLAIVTVVYTVFTVLIFKVSIKKSILANAVYIGIVISLDMLALLILQKIIKADGISDVTLQNGAFITELICQLVMLVIVMVLNIVTQKGALSNLDIKGWLTFALFPLLTLASVVILVFSADKQNINDMYYGIAFLAGGMLLLNILLFILLDNVVRRENDIRNKERLLEQTAHINQMYRSLSEEREKQKARSHDYMNHLNVMLMLAREGKVDEEIHYIEEQLGKEVQSVDIIDTGNTLINAVLNIKYLEAKEKGIIIPFIADNLTGLKISDSDLVTILTNVLDNAIEAVQKCEEKRLVFKIIKDYDTLIIDSSNPYVGQLPDEESLVTTKSDKNNHGFGLVNIKKTVEANNGNCFIETKGGIFHISIAIPLA